MGKPLIYLDHAATSFPKPESVYLAQDRYLRTAGNPGRGAHEIAFASAQTIFESRAVAADFLGVGNSERLLFTPGCTYSINMVIKGFGFAAGDCVLTSALEHNSVMRALNQVEALNAVRVVVLPYAPNCIVDVEELRRAILREKPRLCVFTEASNVTGERLDTEVVAEICAAHNIPLLVDAAQTSGTEENCLRHEGITFWATPGHKGLLGSPGVGLLYVRESYDLRPLVQGGTGSGSESFEMPSHYPDHLEAGTLPGPAIAALGAGIEHVRETGANSINEKENSLSTQFRTWCLDQDWIKVYGFSSNPKSANPTRTAPIVSFDLEGVRPDRVADQLNESFGIAVRAGLHCAALAHQTLGTTATGLVRASFGMTNSVEDVQALCDALTAIHKSR